MIGVLISLPVADRLVRMLAETGSLRIDEAASLLLALPGPADRVACDLVEELVRTDARIVRQGERLLLAPSPFAEVPLGEARFAVLDLETEGGVATRRIRELGLVLLDAGRFVDELELRPETGEEALTSVGRILDAAGDRVLVGHNVAFDCRLLDGQLGRRGERLAAPVVDTLRLARRLLAGRADRYSLAALVEFFGTPTRSCHRALPDARATAEILLRMIELATERGARTVGDLCSLARPRRQVRAWR